MIDQLNDLDANTQDLPINDKNEDNNDDRDETQFETRDASMDDQEIELVEISLPTRIENQ